MKYLRAVEYVSNVLWVIHPDKLQTILSVLAFRASGDEFTPEEIKSQIGSGAERASARGNVAVVPLRGTIAHRIGMMDESSGGISAERFTTMMNAAVADPSIGSIVIDCDSPGGTIPGVPEAAAAVYAARGVKPVVAVANSMMASAAYWICSQADEIVAIPSIIEGKIGSIGAYFAHKDMSAALEKEGVKITLISAGKYKTEGNPLGPLTPEAEAILQTQANDAHGAFMKDVARGRGVTPSAVRDGFGEGRALNAKDALNAGMVDSIGTMSDTVVRLLGKKSSGGMRASDVRTSRLI